ncbi:MAG: DUF3800 domain-containing protein [Bacteroidota bacterium]
MDAKGSLKRRQFLGKGATALGAVSLLPLLGFTEDEALQLEAKLTAPVKTIFVSESGAYAEKGVPKFVLGALRANDPEKAESDFKAYRNTHNYFTKLSYKSTDKYKGPLVNSWIQYMLNSNGNLNFRAHIIDNPQMYSGQPVLGMSKNNNPSRLKRWDEKTNIYKGLVQNWSKAPDVVVKSQSSFGPTQSFIQNFLSKTGKNIASVATHDCQLLQFADFLTGCIWGDITQTQSTVKKACINDLKSLLSVSELSSVNKSAFKVS